MPGMGIKERFVVDDQGKKVGVFLDIEDYERLLVPLQVSSGVRAWRSSSGAPLLPRDREKGSGDEGHPLPPPASFSEVKLDRH